MILAATRPDPERGKDQDLTDHVRNLQTKIRQTWNEIQRRKWPTLPLECLPDDVAEFVDGYLAQLSRSSREEGVLLARRRQLVETVRTHPLATNALFLTTLLRGVSHAEALGHDPRRCLDAWMLCRTAAELLRLVVAVFEAGPPRRSRLDAAGVGGDVRRLGPMLGDALSLLFVARHGLHEGELFELLGRVSQQSSWNKETEGTVVQTKLKILQVLKHNKNRLIDIFR